MRAFAYATTVLGLATVACEPPAAATVANAAPARQADTVLTPWNPTVGAPAPGMRWVRHDAPRFCEWPQGGGTHVEPDSAIAVAAARRALDATNDSTLMVRTALRAGEGYFLQFVPVPAPGTIVMDGSASVYVTSGPCVALLGW